MMRFSVIIPTRNRPKLLAACLASFSELDYPAEAWELIIVNDGGQDPFSAVPPPLPNSLPLTLVNGLQAGPAAARNRGAAKAAYEYLAFTDDDCCITPDWLRQFADGFTQTGCAALGGGWRNPQPHNMAMRASHFLIEFMYDYMRDELQNHLMLVSNNAAYRRDAFTAVRGFDESFPLAAAEDMELSFRFVAHGFRQGYWPAAKVWHHHNLNPWGHVRQQFRYGRGGHYFLQAVDRQAKFGRAIQPGPAWDFYRALAKSVRQQAEPWSFAALIAIAQTAYRFGQFYQRQISRLTAVTTA